MEYKKYIELGFKRTDTNDVIEFNKTGYKGFYLTKKLNKNTSIEVCYPELDRPKLYIKKRQFDLYHIIVLKTEVVEDLLSEKSKEDGWEKYV
jgi:hypothetical protein